MMWTRTSRSHDIAGPVHQVSVLVVLDGGACPGALQAPTPMPPPGAKPPHATAAHAPSRHTHATSHGERHAIATTRVVLYPTIRQWNGCPSDKRQLVWCVVHAVKGRTGGRCGPRWREPEAARGRWARAPAGKRSPFAGRAGAGEEGEGSRMGLTGRGSDAPQTLIHSHIHRSSWS